MKIFIGLLPNDSAYNYVRTIEFDLSKKFGLHDGLKYSPHITVKIPFNIKTLEPFVRGLERVVKNIKPFDIKIDGFDFFRNEVIFLNVKENPPLQNLHEKLLSNLQKKYKIKPQRYEGKKIRFHYTVALHIDSESKFLKAKTYLKKYKPLFTFKAKSIGIFLHLKQEDCWIIVKKIKLG